MGEYIPFEILEQELEDTSYFAFGWWNLCKFHINTNTITVKHFKFLHVFFNRLVIDY